MPMQRKTVTVVFCDVTGSTELGESTDPEALRALLARYFERMKGIVQSHGGSVEKFISHSPTRQTLYWFRGMPGRTSPRSSGSLGASRM
jgi:hypothetical protein